MDQFTDQSTKPASFRTTFRTSVQQATQYGRKLLILLVGAARFELTTPCAQGRCATRLRYAPTFNGLFILKHFLTRRTSRRSVTLAQIRPTVLKPC